jgi:UDP-N-acetylmuramoyl-tripeptide--D-alanyl-D-alanine ligase
MAVRTFTADEIAAATVGQVLRPAAGPVAGLCLDSRSVKAGNLFAALPGAKADGHAYCAQAAAAGAACVLVSRDVEVPEGCGIVLVGSVEGALRALGMLVRSEFRGEVVGVVGSCGKTTTKDFTAAVLRRTGSVDATAGNRNNLLGVPETLMGADLACRFWVLELGISQPDEMAALAPIARPTGVVMTTIQPVHTEFFPSLEAIRDEKARVFESAEPGAFGALNAEDSLLRGLRLPSGMERILYGFSEGADVRVEATGEAGSHGTAFRLTARGASADGFLPVPGAHNLLNFAAACAAGSCFHASPEEMAAAAADLRPARHRGESYDLREDIYLLDDSYNANPSAVAAVLRSTTGWNRRVVAAVGEMLELGTSGPAHHEAAGHLAADLGVAALLAVGGENAALMAEAFAASGRPTLHAATWREGAEWFESQLEAGDGALVKGSRGIGLNGLVDWLIERRGA